MWAAIFSAFVKFLFFRKKKNAFSELLRWGNYGAVLGSVFTLVILLNVDFGFGIYYFAFFSPLPFTIILLSLKAFMMGRVFYRS